MNKKEFFEACRQAAEHNLPCFWQEPFTVSIRTLRGMNGLEVRRRHGKALFCDLDSLWNNVKTEEDVPKAISMLLKSILLAKPPINAEAILNNFEAARRRLFVKLVPEYKVQEGDPSWSVLGTDLAFTAHVLVDADEKRTAPITPELLEYWGVPEGDMFQIAILNTPALFPMQFISLWEITNAMMGKDIRVDDDTVWIVTNEWKQDGAAALFYPDSFEKIVEKCGGSFYAIPSSVHEFLVMSDKEMTPMEIEEFVLTATMTSVAPEDQLAFHGYHYDAEAKQFESIFDWTERTGVCPQKVE